MKKIFQFMIRLFDKVFENNYARLWFHYTVSKDSFTRLEQVVNGPTDMDLSKEKLLEIRKLYLNSNDKDRIRLGISENI